MNQSQAYQDIDALYTQLDRIESEPSSYLGGLKAYMSGYQLCYTLRAEAKIKSIKAKIEHLQQFIEEV
jgi:hypothetical protein